MDIVKFCLENNVDIKIYNVNDSVVIELMKDGCFREGCILHNDYINSGEYIKFELDNMLERLNSRKIEHLKEINYD